MMIGDFKVPGTIGYAIGFDLAVDAAMFMPTADLSGNTSSTDKADKGIKPKKLKVAFSLRETKDEMAVLTNFMTLAEAKNADSEAREYVVVHPLAQSLRIRLMRFVGEVSVSDHDTQKQYDIMFTLEEVRSVPEASEARSQSRTSGGQPATSFSQVLQKVEEQVAGT